jgi:AbiV family abortive infection protein
MSAFSNLDRQQCLNLYELVRQNARRHYVAADLLAKEQDFGNSVAHLILGAEELLKSAMLMLQGYDFPVTAIKNYDKLFYNHAARHNLLKECYSIYLFVFEIVKKGPAENPKHTRGQHWALLLIHGLQSAKKGIDNYEWWDRADKLKQNCFYVDYNDQGPVDPFKITEDDWLSAHQFVSAFTVDLNNLMIKIANAKPHELLEYQDEFNDAELTGLFSESINRKRQS